MIRIEGSRGTGKTTKLIEYAQETGSTIIASTSQMAKFIENRAKDMEKHVDVICIHDLDRIPTERGKKYVIDELELFLWQLLYADVLGYTSDADIYDAIVTLKRRPHAR